MIIGLTGKNAAGKGELAKHLESKGYFYISLSDALRAEATARGLNHERETMIALGNELRASEGVGTLAKRTNIRIEKEQANGVKNFVIDSIRAPGEIEELHTNKEFILIGVHTDDEIRFERLLKRGRAGDAKTFAEFQAHEQAENATSGPGQQLDKCLSMVDYTVNSNGTVQEANEELDALLVTLEKV